MGKEGNRSPKGGVIRTKQELGASRFEKFPAAVMRISSPLLLPCFSLNLHARETWGIPSMLPFHKVHEAEKHKIDFVPSILPPKRSLLTGDRGPGTTYRVLSQSQDWDVVLFPLKYFIFEKTHQVCFCQNCLPGGLAWVRSFTDSSLISRVPKTSQWGHRNLEFFGGLALDPHSPPGSWDCGRFPVTLC